ncbi:MAG: hypothetical protein EA375_02250 [Acholeplasmataceae bacterium]|nr:MAG: hypothetical protein EA375_02250 [Acholeplasmataceae bacterium]
MITVVLVVTAIVVFLLGRGSGTDIYTLAFDSRGGSALAPMLTDGKSAIQMPADPVKEGHTFQGWYFDETYDDPFTVETLLERGLDGNLTIYARWEIQQFTIAFDSAGGTAISSITYDFDAALDEYTDPTREGYTFLGWNPEPPETMPAQDIILIALWQVNQYTITFDSSGGSLIEAITQEYDTAIHPPVPTRTGYTFDGWSPSLPSRMPAADISLTAIWSMATYDIDYELDGGINHEDNPSSYNILSNIMLWQPDLAGYTFIGWYDNPAFEGDVIEEISAGQTGNITLYAKWSVHQYEIGYMMLTDDYDPNSAISLMPEETIIQVSLNGSHSAVLTSLGRIFTWGYNAFGQLGDGTTEHRYTPIEITSQFGLVIDETIIHVALGGFHSTVLTSAGRVFTWGRNSSGQLGDGTTTDRHAPTDITHQFGLVVDESIIQISLGTRHSAASTSAGRVFTWGNNVYFELGDGTWTHRNTPTDITAGFGLSGGETIIQVSLGFRHSAALTSEGRVFTWGDNGAGSLGDGTNTDRIVPTEITAHFNLELNEMIIRISMGNGHSSALTSDGRLFMWGYNPSGQLGIGTTTNINIPTEVAGHLILQAGETFIQISLGDFHSAALTSTGRLFTWGWNNSGQLGNGTTTDNFASNPLPIDITSNLDLLGHETVVQVVLGGSHSSCLTSTGRVFVWGSNTYGQIGDGTTTHHTTPYALLRIQYTGIQQDVYDVNETILLNMPVREGYTFGGWYVDPALTELFMQTTMPAENILLYGYWIKD